MLIRPNSLGFQAPSFKTEEPVIPGAYRNAVSVFLFMNNRSLLYDPVEWPRTRRTLSEWLAEHAQGGKICEAADKKFGERLVSIAPRRLATRKESKCPVLTLMSPLPQRQCQASLRKQVGQKRNEVNIINSGSRQATTIGLFPHALKHMVKLKYPLEGV